jgi:small conductance mechanosensitive channel
MQELITQAYETLGSTVTSYGLRVLGAILILVVGWMGSAWAQRRVRRAVVESASLDSTLAPILAKVTRIALLLITVVAVLNAFDVQTASIIALMGGAAVGIGLALQGTLSNVASGLVLVVLKPIRVDEAVNVGGADGRVVEIGLFATTLENLNGETVTMPNSNVWGSEIKNYSRSGKRRLKLELGIGYGDDMEAALAIVLDVMRNHPDTLSEPAPAAGILNHGDSPVGILALPWVKPDDYYRVHLELMQRFKAAFDAKGISIPFPQRDLHIISENVGLVRGAA